jgi:hypothetical protein
MASVKRQLSASLHAHRRLQATKFRASEWNLAMAPPFWQHRTKTRDNRAVHLALVNQNELLKALNSELVWQNLSAKSRSMGAEGCGFMRRDAAADGGGARGCRLLVREHTFQPPFLVLEILNKTSVGYSNSEGPGSMVRVFGSLTLKPTRKKVSTE